MKVTEKQDVLSPGEDSVCTVCYDAVADMVLVPCHHLVLCAVRNPSTRELLVEVLLAE